eukprot:CAMPEP_0119108536 /NCGR_PEP_ID=MMETSP1180-20130426/15010_1 /TAXON_ID=3052 ORGANISM="Chlamydomonas cf sp, Strain CCMP681" /NCGR_SAMPLE_ID=MMETSP1180 /ASSEMBLY_ACC=CAM_ASM_000741 /LENGTH=31 /DNA_ID= /DNA_START= /DNA_END= /DNA_ORIENTATION=
MTDKDQTARTECTGAHIAHVIAQVSNCHGLR